MAADQKGIPSSAGGGGAERAGAAADVSGARRCWLPLLDWRGRCAASESLGATLPLRPSFSQRPDTRFKSEAIHRSFRSVGDAEQTRELSGDNSRRQ